jgi:hypothetical protein
MAGVAIVCTAVTVCRCRLASASARTCPISLHTRTRTWISVVPRFPVVEDVLASKRHAVPRLRARAQIRARFRLSFLSDSIHPFFSRIELTSPSYFHQADAHVKAGVVNRVVALLTSGTSASSSLRSFLPVILCFYRRDECARGGEFPKKEERQST